MNTNLPMRTWVPAALLTIFVAFLAVRLVWLDRNVKALERSVGVSREEEKPSGDPAERTGLGDRIAELESDVRDLQSRVALLEARQKLALLAPPEDLDPEKAKDTILSIMADEADRVLEKQLTWHKDNLLSMRKPGFAQFQRDAELTDAQGRHVWSQLEIEAQELVNLFRIPEVREDPNVLIREVKAVLQATDDRVRPVLDGPQTTAYLAARSAERAAVMPWLNRTAP